VAAFKPDSASAMCIFAEMIRNACFLGHALENFMNWSGKAGPGKTIERRELRASRCACTHHACGVGSHQQPAHQDVRRGFEVGQDLLDRLSQGDADEAEDRDLPGLAVGGGC
jgi:hypothetical protein